MSEVGRTFGVTLATSTVLTFTACGIQQPSREADVAFSGTALFARGQQVYDAYCLACHQRSGAGVPGAFPPLAATPILEDRIALIRATLFGRPGTAMPSHCNFDAGDIAAVLTYVRNAWIGTPKESISTKDVLLVSADPGSPLCQPTYKR